MSYPYDPWDDVDVPLLDDYTDLELGYDEPIPEPTRRIDPNAPEDRT